LTHWIEERACAKINLALHVLGRREDGYHEIDSVVAFADFGDEVKLRRAAKTSLTVTGPFAAAVPLGQDNIILKAVSVLSEIFKMQPPTLEICLEKNLPVASGVGGGSADAAATLRAVLRLTERALTADQIQKLAKSLGADVPVCFAQRACHMQGIGEIIRPLTITLPKAIVLVNPQKPCSTQAVFAKLALRNGQTHLSKVEIESAPTWRNDLTHAACEVEPEINKVLKALEAEQVFSNVRMSGSGATCFGLISNMSSASAAAARLSVRNPGWWVKALELL
jgi:4-diphosphocytidyl-2-C-methyl-D-erythritol kinase